MLDVSPRRPLRPGLRHEFRDRYSRYRKYPGSPRDESLDYSHFPVVIHRYVVSFLDERRICINTPPLAGMCMLDTTDGALMMALYTSKAFARDTVAILYYSIVLTGITVVVSAFIGIIQLLSLVQNVAEPEGSFWDGLSEISDHFEIVGGCICGLFLVAGLGSVLVYGPWRRRAERRRMERAERLPSDDAGGEFRDVES